MIHLPSFIKYKLNYLSYYLQFKYIEFQIKSVLNVVFYYVIKEFVEDNKTYRYFTDNTYSENSKADFDNKDMTNYIQKNVEYYISKFKDIQELNQSTSWNWAAFFFKPWWFFIQKKIY